MDAPLIMEYARRRDTVIMIGVPTFGVVSIHWHSYMLQLRAPMNRKLQHCTVVGREVGAARNLIVQQALAVGANGGDQAQAIFFVDDDTLIPPDALVKLLAHDRDIVGGLYYSKTDPPEPLVFRSPYGGAASDWTHGELVDCIGHGMGCTLIRLEVFRRLWIEGRVQTIEEPCSVCHDAPERRETCAGCFGTGRVIEWFKTVREHVADGAGVPKAMYQTEDLFFLERAVAAGFRPAVDTGIFCWHWQQTEQRAYPVAQWEEFRTLGTVTWPAALEPVS